MPFGIARVQRNALAECLQRVGTFVLSCQRLAEAKVRVAVVRLEGYRLAVGCFRLGVVLFVNH